MDGLLILLGVVLGFYLGKYKQINSDIKKVSNITFKKINKEEPEFFVEDSDEYEIERQNLREEEIAERKGEFKI